MDLRYVGPHRSDGVEVAMPNGDRQHVPFNGKLAGFTGAAADALVATGDWQRWHEPATTTTTTKEG